MYFVEGKAYDSQILKRMYYDLYSESSLYGDSGYAVYQIEDLIKETELINLEITRKANSKRKNKPHVAYIKEPLRKIIETSLLVKSVVQCQDILMSLQLMGSF